MVKLDRADQPRMAQLHDSVVERWGWDIASGTFPPGTRIVADDAATGFGVSRSVIREAVRVLESLGMLTVRRHVGITVLPADEWNPFHPFVIRWRMAGPDRIGQLQHLSELRSAIEPTAARLAAGRATPEQCGTLTAAVIGMAATARSANAQAYLDHDASFHRTLLLASGNPMFAGFAEVVVEVLTGRTAHALMPAEADARAVQLHGVVAAHIQNGEGDAAHDAMLEIVAESASAVQLIHRANTAADQVQAS